jgi:antitoxin component YwqK of YwqJK toxin-antitoxin module
MPKLTPRVISHQDGSLWAKGQVLAGKMHGYWEWFRKDGTRLRSGHFDRDTQCGEWITYDRQGKVHKVTQMKSKPAPRAAKK